WLHDNGGSMTDDGYAIGELAGLARVTVRTLHHYDEIGLLRPSGRTVAGHRRYSADDLDRLRQILVYRELDFGLDAIGAMLADPDSGVEAHLRNQHRMLRARIGPRPGAAARAREGTGGPHDGNGTDARGAVRGVRHGKGWRRVGCRGGGALGRHRCLARIPTSCRDVHERGLGRDESAIGR